MLVTVVPMRGSLIGATDSEGGHVFVRADASMAEIGAAILAGVHEVAAAWYPPAGVESAPVIPLPRTSDDQEEVRRGLG